MTTTTNQFNEIVTKWENNIHPDNNNFQQIVFWKMWEKPNGKILLGYNLIGYASKMKFFYNLTKNEIVSKFM